MADIVLDAEINSNIGQLNKDLEQTASKADLVKNTFKLAGSAISVTQGAMKLLGTDSEKVNKAIMQVQAAMALNQGLQSLMQQADTIKTIYKGLKTWAPLQKVINALQWVWNAAMAANPIGAVVVAVTALIAAGKGLISFFKSSAQDGSAAAQANEDLAKSIANVTEASKAQVEANSRERKQAIELAKIRGITLKQLHAEERAAIEADLTDARIHRDQMKRHEQKMKMANESSAIAYQEGKITKEQREVIRKAYKNSAQEREDAQTQIENLKGARLDLIDRHEREVTQAEVDAADERDQKAEKAEQRRLDKEKQAKKDRYNANVSYLKELKKLEEEAELAAIADEQEREERRREIEFENEKKALEDSAAGPKVKAAMLKELEDEYQRDIQGIRKEYDDEAEEERKERSRALQDLINENNDALLKTEEERQLAELERQKALEEEELRMYENFQELKIELDKKYKRLAGEVQDEADEEEKEKAQEVFDFKMDLVRQGLDVFLTSLDNQMAAVESEQEKEVALAEAQGRDTTMINKKYDREKEKLADKQKKINVGLATMDMFQSAAGAYTQAMGLPPPAGLIMAPLAAGMALAAGAANIQSILQADVGGGGSGGAVAPTPRATPAPQMMSGAFSLEQSEAPEPIKAFVVTDEMTNSQNQLANIRRRATI